MIKLSEKFAIIKNYLAINLSTMLLFAAFNSASSIQPIVNQDAGFGTIAQIVTYVINLFTCLVFPQILLDLIGFKYTYLLAIFLVATYVFIQIHLKYYTLIIAAVLSGLGSSFIWPTFGIYLTLCNKNYIKLTEVDFSSFQTLFFGISGAIYLWSYVFGYGLVAVILDTSNSSINQSNLSVLSTDFDYASSCGINNCPSTILPSSQALPTTISFNILYAVLVGFCILAFMIVLFFMDDIKGKNEADDDKRSALNIAARFKNEFISLAKLYSNLDVWLLLPVTFYSGFELTYIWFEYSRAFATCLLGVNYVGWTNILFGGLGSIFSLGITYLLKYIGVQLGIIFMIMTSVIQCIFIISWTPVYNNATAIFLMGVAFALTLSVYMGQIRGIYGVYFPNNQSAFSAVAIGQTIGIFSGSLLSTYSCTRFKTYFYLGTTILSLFTYIFLLLKHSIIQNRAKENLKEKDIVLSDQVKF